MENNNRFLFFDTETNDLSPNQVALQLAWILTDGDGREIIRNSYYLKRDVCISPAAFRTHQISTSCLMEEGSDPRDVYLSFLSDVEKCTHLIAHNAKFDIETVQNDLSLLDVDYDFSGKVLICTMTDTKHIVKSTDKNGRLKNPRLEEFAGLMLHGNKEYEFLGLHDAMEDTRLLKESFFKLKEMATSIYHEVNATPVDQQLAKQKKQNEPKEKRPMLEITDMPTFITEDELQAYDMGTIFRDKKVLVTGVLSDIGILDRTAAAGIIERLGGIVQKTIVKDIDFVVIGDDCGPKKMQTLCDMQAKAYKVKCIDKYGMKLICEKIS